MVFLVCLQRNNPTKTSDVMKSSNTITQKPPLSRKYLIAIVVSCLLIAIEILLILNPKAWDSSVNYISRKWGDFTTYFSDLCKTSSQEKGSPERILGTIYVKERAERMGTVYNISRIRNGSYYGFPIGDDIETYQITVWIRGHESASEVVIAIRPSQDGWETLRCVIN